MLAQILMGDIPGALRSYLLLMERDQREYSRIIVDKLGAVREARTAVIRNFAVTSPPKAYGGTDKPLKERFEDRKARYTQFFQMSTQTMNELQTAERELNDALQSHARNIEQMWQKIAQLQEENYRVNDRLART